MNRNQETGLLLKSFVFIWNVWFFYIFLIFFHHYFSKQFYFADFEREKNSNINKYENDRKKKLNMRRKTEQQNY